MGAMQHRLNELIEAHDEWMLEDAGGARLHEAVMAIKNAPKFALGESTLTPLWVYPHDGTYSGETILHASLIDEANLRYRPGMTMGDVEEAIAKAWKDIHNEPMEADDRASIKGAWVVPNHIWVLIGAIWSTESITGDSAEYAVREAQQRAVASQALFTLGEQVEDPRASL